MVSQIGESSLPFGFARVRHSTDTIRAPASLPGESQSGADTLRDILSRQPGHQCPHT